MNRTTTTADKTNEQDTSYFNKEVQTCGKPKPLIPHPQYLPNNQPSPLHVQTCGNSDRFGQSTSEPTVETPPTLPSIPSSSSNDTYKLIACNCRSYFCRSCCTSMGLKLRSRLKTVVETFSDVQQITLTVDPSLFATPADALTYLKDHKCVAELVKVFKRRGFLHSNRYFCVTELQPETGMPHFHLLTDSTFIPFDVLCDTWNSYRPESAGPAEGSRPGLGSVHIQTKQPCEAATYCTKTLVDYPESGWPSWLTDKSSVPLYSVSKSFWGSKAQSTVAPRMSINVRTGPPPIQRAKRRTIKQKLQSCGERSVVLRSSEFVNPNTGELTRSTSFCAALSANVATAADVLERSIETGARHIDGLEQSDLAVLLSLRATPRAVQTLARLESSTLPARSVLVDQTGAAVDFSDQPEVHSTPAQTLVFGTVVEDIRPMYVPVPILQQITGDEARELAIVDWAGAEADDWIDNDDEADESACQQWIFWNDVSGFQPAAAEPETDESWKHATDQLSDWDQQQEEMSFADRIIQYARMFPGIISALPC